MIDNPLIEEFLDHLRHKRHCSPYTAKCYATDLLQFQGYLLEEADDRSETSTTAGVSDLNSSEGGTGLAVLTSRSVVTLAARCASPVSLVETTTEDVQRFLASLRRRGCTEGTVARKLATLRSLFRFCLKRCYNRSDPSAFVQSPRREIRPPRSLKDDDFRRLLEAPDTSTLLGVRDRAILEAMLSTGLRASELVDLSIRDFNPLAKTLCVRGQGRKQRTVSLPSGVWTCIEKYLDMRGIHPRHGTCDEGVLFANKHGQRLSTRSIRRKLDKYLAAAGLDPTISPHTLRQSFAVRMLRSGADPRSVQKQMGHLSISSVLNCIQMMAKLSKDGSETVSAQPPVPATAN